MQKRKSSSANLIPKSEFEFTFFNSDNGKWKHGFIGFGVIMVTGIGWIIHNNTKTEKTRKRKHKKQNKN